jgi:DNA-binding SARP family transcriptional activator
VVHRILTAGDLLNDWYDSWVIEHRERLRQLRLHALESLSVRQLERGEVTAAIESALAAVAAEPLRESANRVLIRAHLKEANNAEALRQYERFRLLLFQELGIWPSAQLEELMAPVRAGAGRAAAHT